jgi:hypothetical protein
MSEGVDHLTARELLEVVHRELAGVERDICSHPFLAALDEGRVPRDRVGDFADEQYAILSSDRRSFTVLAARFPQSPGGDLFLGLAEGERQALGA